MLKLRIPSNVAAAIVMIIAVGIIFWGYVRYIKDPPKVTPEETRAMMGGGQRGGAGGQTSGSSGGK